MAERAGATAKGGADAIKSQWPVLICVLGAFRVLKLGRPIPVRSGGKTQGVLLKLSVSRGYCASREALLETVWPSSVESLSKQCLHSVVHGLHKLLGEAIGGAAPVLYADGYYRLNTAAGVSVDVACFDALARRGAQQARRGNVAAASTAYRQALHLYRGDLCVATDAHAVVERERVRTLHLTTLAHLADCYYSEGDYEACLKVTLQLLTHDPCREDGHRTAMRCHVRLGERAQALRQYMLCEAVLRTEFNAKPEPATTVLFDQVRLDPGSV